MTAIHDRVYAGPFPIHDADTKFFAQAGACLMEWAGIDAVLFNICSTVLGASDALAEVVYQRTPTLETRLTLIASLLTARFPTASGEQKHQFIVQFANLVRTAQKLSKVRNDIAHGGRLQINHMLVNATTEKAVGHPGYHPVIVTSEYRKNGAKAIDFAALQTHQKEVFNFAMDLRAFREHLIAEVASKAPKQASMRKPKEV